MMATETETCMYLTVYIYSDIYTQGRVNGVSIFVNSERYS
jgi:hypothetical protein